MSVLAANSQILWREFHHRDHHHQQQLCASTGNYSFFAGKSGGFWGDFRNREDKKTSKRDVRAEAFWPDLSKPASVVMEPISDCDHLDRILSHAQEISQPILIDWMASWCRKCIYLKPKLEKLAADYDTKTQPENEERDRTASARRRRRFKAAIGVATAAAAYLATDVVRRPMHNSALRGMDKVNELLTNSNENAMFNKVRMGPRAFMILCEMLTDKGLLRPSYNMSVPEQLFVFLTIISQSQSNREAQDVWQHSGETISRRFSEVLNAICALEEEFIKPPNYAKVPKFLRANRQRYGSWFDAHLTAHMYLAHQLVFLTQRLTKIERV